MGRQEIVALTVISLVWGPFLIWAFWEDIKTGWRILTPWIPRRPKGETNRRVTCYGCQKEVLLISVAGHSVGALHAICPICKNCPDCDDGAV